MTDIEFLHAKIRGLENENRALRETLRDKFAAAALTGLLSDEGAFITHDARADFCWRQADAMLEARRA